MSLTEGQPADSQPIQGETACGSLIQVALQTPYVLYRGKVIYFCQPDCKELYQKDPLNSCMAARILMDR